MLEYIPIPSGSRLIDACPSNVAEFCVVASQGAYNHLGIASLAFQLVLDVSEYSAPAGGKVELLAVLDPWSIRLHPHRAPQASVLR